MNESIKRYLYIIMIIGIVVVVGSIFIKLLPFLIIAGIISYIVITVKGKIKQRNSDNINRNHQDSRNFDDSRSFDDVYNSSSDDYTTGEIIDVDYEDVDKKDE